MKIISENLHIISKQIKEALINRDEKFFVDFISAQILTKPDFIDLNIGPGKKALAESMKFLTEISKNLSQIPISFDSTNIDEIKSGLEIVDNPSECIVNSTSSDEDRLENYTDLVQKYGCSLIALTLNREIGIPKTADGRLELAFNIIEKTTEKNIPNEKIIFDPLILPVSVEQSQAKEALESIRMFKESFDPQVKTVVGLSNISNGSPKELRPLINRTFMTLAKGCGLDFVIADSFDDELLHLNKVLDTKIAQNESDELNLELANMMENFGELSDISYDKHSIEQVKIFKTAEILLNKKIYSHSFTEI